GRVTFQNVPKGVYTLKVNEKSGSRLTINPEIGVERNINMNLGLIKSIRVAGRLEEVRQPYDILETNVAGIMVYAKSEEGLIQSAVVNQDHQFEFFLKDGKYDIYIENDKYSFINPKQTIEVRTTEPADSLLFEYKKKDTTIKVRKF